MPSALELEAYWIDRLSFDQRGSHIADQDDRWEPNLDWSVYQAAEAGEARYLVNLKIRLPKESPSPRGIIELSGVFVFHEADGETPETLLNFNGPSILYGIARGATSMVTALMPSGRVTLPSVNFVEVGLRRASKGRRRLPAPKA